MKTTHLSLAIATTCLALLGAAPAASAHVAFAWRTDHFTSSLFTADPAFSNLIRIPAHPRSPATLLVFLPGTGGDNVEKYKAFLDRAADHGYYVIGLAYRNTEHHPHMVGCWPAAPSFYFEQNVRGTENGFWRDDMVQNHHYPEFNSVTYRLRMILDTMTKEHPGNVTFDWNQFWDSAASRPNWARIVVAGHSQGGSTAAWIMKNEHPQAALVFDGAYDRLNIGPPDVGGGKSPWKASSPDCDGHKGDVAPSWIEPGAWTQRMIIIDAADSSAYDGSWDGHHLEKTARDLGKTMDIRTGVCPSSLAFSWFTSLTPSPQGCSGHQSTIVDNCTPAWIPCLWDLVLEKSASIVNPPLIE
jgi:hypothetical protein